ncbi:MAG: SpoIIE family protein phosphatase, partial [Acidimicrobiales bacterium]
RPIVDRRDGSLVPAADRPLYHPVGAVFPDDEPTRTVLGFDILADPVRGRAAVEARDSGRTVLTEPVRSASDQAVSFFLVKPLYRVGEPLDTTAQRRTAHAGFVATVYNGDDFAEAIVALLPAGSRFRLDDGDAMLASSDAPPRNGSRLEVTASGRQWALVVEDGRAVDRSLAGSLVAFASLLLAGLVLFFRRAEAHDRASRRSALVIGRTADVAQALAAAGTLEAVEAVIRDHLPGVLGATSANLGLVDHDAGILRTAALGADLIARYAEIPLTTPVPIAEVVRTGDLLLLRTHADWREHAPAEVVDDVMGSGIVSAACLPLEDRHGQVAATLALSWDHEVDFDAPTLDTLRTMKEMCEYTVDRARSTDQAAQRASALAHLAARLAGAVTVAEVLDTLTESGGPVGATATSIGLVDAEAGRLRTHHGRSVVEEIRRQFTDPPLDAPLAFTEAARTGDSVLIGDYDAFTERYPDSAESTSSLGFGARAALPLRNSEGKVTGAIVHAWGGPRVFHAALVSTLLTIAEMAGQALERANLAEAEHRLVTTLQDSVLVPLPDAERLDIAARYRPASHDVGMGGDWYEGIVLDEHRYALIIGDVAGHGITAVGEMAQLRAVIGALVRLGTDLGEVFAQTTALLQAAAHNPTASALLLVIDTQAATIAYAAAGHPPALLLSPAGETTVLAEGRHPILGIEIQQAQVSEISFPVGSVLLAYTDGLIERRGEAIDHSIDRLRNVFQGAPRLAAEGLTEHLLRACLDGRETDDDVALVVVGHCGP